MQRLLLAASLALSSLLAQAEVIDIDNAQLAKLMQGSVPVIDIRLQSEWEETGIVAGSKLHTFFDERGKADPAAWLDKVKPYAKPSEPVIVICRTGNRTKAVSQFLSQQAGYTTVYNVKAGIKGWIRESGPVVPAAPVIAACRSAKTC
nr:rhodanese-like domain-containing protein [Dechloromonas sp.]